MVEKIISVALASLLLLSLMTSPAMAVGDEGFETPQITDHVGDKSTIVFTGPSNSSEQVQMKIGSEEEVGYELVLAVNSSLSSYSTITVEFDTSKAGTGQNPITVVDTPWGVDKSDIRVVKETRISSPPLDPESYTMRMYESGNLYDIGKLELKPAGEPMPIGVTRAMDSGDREDIVEGDSTTFDTVSITDSVVFEVNAQGTESYIPGGVNATELRKGGPIHQEYGIYAEFKPQESPNNAASESLPLDGMEVYRNKSTDELFLAANLDEYNTIDVGSSYEFTIVVTDSSKYLEAGEYTTKFTVVEAKGSFDTNEKGDIVLEKNYQVEVTGDVTLAPGSEITPFLKSEDKPFFQRDIITVDENGEFTAQFETEELEAGTNLTAGFSDIEGSAPVLIAGEDGVVYTTSSVEGTQTTVVQDNGDETTQNGEEVTTTKDKESSTTTQDKTDDTGNMPDPGQPGFGGVVGLFGFIVAAVLLWVRS